MKYDPERHRRRSVRLRGFDYCAPGAYFLTLVADGRENLFGDIVDGAMRRNVLGDIVHEEWLSTAKVRSFVRVPDDAFVVMPNHLHGILWIEADPTRRQHPNGPRIVGAQRRCAPTDGAVDGVLSYGDRVICESGADVARRHNDPRIVGAQRRCAPGEVVDVGPRAQQRCAPTTGAGEHGDIGPRVAPGSLGAIVRGFKAASARRINSLRGTPGAAVWQRNYYEHIVRDDDDLAAILGYIERNPLEWELDRENARGITAAR